MIIGILVCKNTGNLGDWYQSGASLYLWWCYFNKPDTFLVFLNNVINTSRLDKYDVMFIDRDRISESIKPLNNEKVILLCNAWWMQAINKRLDFPPPDWIIPIYTSVHISKPELLSSPKVINHFKKYEPIGCRDLSTFRLFKDKNIAAEFSGCLTTIFNLRDDALGFKITKDYQGVEVENDLLVPISKDSIKMTQKVKGSADMQSIILAIQSTYNLLFAKNTTTSRLHVWLPLISNGANCILINKKTGQQFKEGDSDNQGQSVNRFTGIIDLVNWPGFSYFKQKFLNETLVKIDMATKPYR
uniref:Uncharacterized protein n=1 Tax=viral metagenome TaxID=1070528 RepID=A0A6C0DJ57_9ZZZZ